MHSGQSTTGAWGQTARLVAVIGLLTALTACGTTADPLTEDQVDSARDDLPEIYNSECYASYDSSALGDCVLTNDDEAFDVYLVGDSHAAHWVPALQEIADDHNWRLTFYGKRACSFSINEQSDNQGNDYPSCEDWNDKLQDKIQQERPEVVITSNYSRNYVMEGDEILERGPGTPGEAELADGMVAAWEPVLDAGSELIVIRDTPKLTHDVPDCLLENLSDPAGCDVSYKEAVENLPQPERMAVERLPGAETINLNEELCPGKDGCLPVNDGAVVWRDSHHLTASYSKQLHDELADDLSGIQVLSEHM
ncbi:SGNH hydrolase domain-containing protein [Leucobacter sp. GX24907]